MTRTIALTVAAVTISLAQSVVEGNAGSTVRVIAYEDLQCPDCAVYRRLLDHHLLPKYKDRVAFEHRDFPLVKHKWARPAAIVARHFDRTSPALGIDFRRWAYANIPTISPDNATEKFQEWAKAQGQDPAAVVKALSDPALTKLVEEDYQEGIARGVARTPLFS